ncbi:hypothetical protein HDF14_003611 [Edaphobacter lichenicola]|jgi:hypothetical protein|uniref:Uncharacterized protein n=1 Tax=Tunturiibacter gelidiferens TaxID=3069689 RepID=A0A9X0QGF1_9BACT|nr:hypothetical protein [Edaphobacter lichenicola]
MSCSNEPGANITVQRDPIRLSDVPATTLIYGNVEPDPYPRSEWLGHELQRFILLPGRSNSVETHLEQNI